MPPLTIAALAQALATAKDPADALLVLRSQLDETARGTVIAFFRRDLRRELVVERMRATESGVVREAVELSLDHLPPKLRREVLAGGHLVDFAEQSPDYLKFFGLADVIDAYLLVQGVHFETELVGVIVVREPKPRFGARAAERIAAPVAMYALVVAQFAERDARREAERAVQDLVGRLHEEYGRSLSDLRKQLGEARRQLSVAGTDGRAAELERAARDAADEARGALERLGAIEQQVAAAVSQLEKAHLDLSRQSDVLRSQGNLLHRIERLLTEATAEQDPRKVLEEVLAAVSAR